MYQRFSTNDVSQIVKSCKHSTILINCLLGTFFCLIFSVIILGLLPLYLPIHQTNLDNNRVINAYVYYRIQTLTPNQSNTNTILIDRQNWPLLNEKTTNLIRRKISKSQFSDIYDVRIVNSETIDWCNTNDCLRVLGKIYFSSDCSIVCQLRHIQKLQIMNKIEPILSVNLNSTSNITYYFEFNAFTVAIAESDIFSENVRMFLVYNLSASQSRSLWSSKTITIDNSSLINITRLVNNSIILSQMKIINFNVQQANIDIQMSLLNVTVLFKFILQCLTDCQVKEMIKLKNSSINNLHPIVINYNGNTHLHNVSLNDVTMDGLVSTIESTSSYSDLITSTTMITSPTTFYMTDTIYAVIYRITSDQLIISDSFETGPIINPFTISDLANMMQTTISNNTNITTLVYNATIEIFDGYSENTSFSINSTDYLLYMIVYYAYPILCFECNVISSNAVYNQPQLINPIQIRNATLIDISMPIYVMDITNPSPSLNFTSTDIRIATSPSTTINSVTSNDTPTIFHNRTQTTSMSTTLHSTEHTSTHTSPHTTDHTTAHTTLHTAVHTSVHTTPHITVHTAEHTSHYTSPHTTVHTTEHTTHQTAAHSSDHSTAHTTHQTAAHSSDHSTTHTTTKYPS